ncbi:putative bifunctional diguanylate cyclase/phosphodiesterase [Roseateles sp. BYS180W]|uniref:Bifunctional diguanylate cyclase/phosphodiesterase n=1 Tax=Roseateles rivi TaxID=3299028 RepID=A0ABW7FVD3_9BURK
MILYLVITSLVSLCLLLTAIDALRTLSSLPADSQTNRTLWLSVVQLHYALICPWLLQGLSSAWLPLLAACLSAATWPVLLPAWRLHWFQHDATEPEAPSAHKPWHARIAPRALVGLGAVAWGLGGLLSWLILLSWARPVGHSPLSGAQWLLPACTAAAGLQYAGLAVLLLVDAPRWQTMTSRLGLGALVVLPAVWINGLLLPHVAASERSEGLLMTCVGAIAILLLALHYRQQLPAHGTDAHATQQLAPSTDPLTHMLSRIGLEEALGLAVLDADRTQSGLAVLSFNLDGFGPINASFGHDAGDEVLRETARRINGFIGTQGSAGRIGADDFVLMLPCSTQRAPITQLTEQLQQALAQPFMVQGNEVILTSSVGMALYPDHGGPSQLLRSALAAKQAAKRLGGACCIWFEPRMGNDARDQLELLQDLRKALERDELELFFQPKIDAASGQVTAAEALLRWRHPTRGMVPPDQFIPVAERFGFMRELGNWVISAACRQAQQWRQHGLRMRVAINLSAHQMRQADIVNRLQDALAECRIHPSLLTCEITESVSMEDTAATQETFRRLGQLGVHLSIDDFGTGYSSLSYLRQLPASELKIDRSFVVDVDTSPDARAVVDAVVKLAHALGLRVVAEGVETERQQNALLALGCDEFQGYLFARPMSAQAILMWAMGEMQNRSLSFRDSLFGGATSYTTMQ